MAAFTDHLRLCDIGVSLGDVLTLVYPQPKRGGLIRVSVGCEDVERPARGLRARAVVRRLRRTGHGLLGPTFRSPAERRRGCQRRPDRQVDAARDLVLRRAKPGLVAGRPDIGLRRSGPR